MKKALITGITGQDGSYLAELLLEKGYEVHGIIRRSSTFNTERIDHIFQDPHVKDAKLILHYGDLTDGSNVARLLTKIKPDEIYHLGAQSHDIHKLALAVSVQVIINLIHSPQYRLDDLDCFNAFLKPRNKVEFHRAS